MRFSSKYAEYRNIFFTSALAFFIRIIGAIAGFVATFFIARELVTVESGYYFLAFSVILILAVVCHLSMDNTVIRFIGGRGDETGGWRRPFLSLAFLVFQVNLYSIFF